MPANMELFLLGLVVGICLFSAGVALGLWLRRNSASTANVVDRQQFLAFLRKLSNWTNQFAGDVSQYQEKITAIQQRVTDKGTVNVEEIGDLLTEIMGTNDDLQNRLTDAEDRLATQTNRISNYLTEARTDGLTGLFNRKAFDQATDELYVDWQQESQAFSLALLDIDHFKKINDNCGHPAGDSVLVNLAQLLQAEFDDAICVARYGGEEFAILSLATIGRFAESLELIRSLVENTEFRHEQRLIPLTVSVGAAAIAPGETIGELVRRADEALYASKLGGRNRVTIHDGAICKLITKQAALEHSRTIGRQTRGDKLEAETARARIHERLQRIVDDESQRIQKR